MASTLSNGLHKVMDGAAFQNPKLADIFKDTKDSHNSNARLATDWGSLVSNTDHWLSVSTEDQYGQSLFKDGHAREKTHRFDHERIPEQVVHARGAGAFGGMRSTIFDSIVIRGCSLIESLRKQGRVLHWVREAFGHLKAIGATGEAVDLVKTAREIDGMRFSAAGSHDVVDSYGVVTAGASKPESFRETINMAKGAKNFVDAYTFNISQHKNFDRELDGLSSMVAF